MKLSLMCLTLGVFTLLGIYAMSLLPPSDSLGSAQEILLMPGAVASSVFWPEGIHSNGGEYWIVSSILGNVVFYSLIWLVAILSGRFFARRRD